LVGGAKIGEKLRQSNSKYNLYATCERYMWCTMGSEVKPQEAGEFLRIFVLKVTLQCVRLLLTVSYRKKGGAACIAFSPNNFAPPSSCACGTFYTLYCACISSHSTKQHYEFTIIKQ